MRDITNYTEERDNLLARRELSKAKRKESMKRRLYVDLLGYKSHYEDI